MRPWRNWQTRMVQVHVKAISWRFKSSWPHQIRTSRLIETLGFLFYISVSKKPFAYAIFRTIRVKVLLYVSNLLSSTAPFLWLFRLEIYVMPKK